MELITPTWLCINGEKEHAYDLYSHMCVKCGVTKESAVFRHPDVYSRKSLSSGFAIQHEISKQMHDQLLERMK